MQITLPPQIAASVQGVADELGVLPGVVVVEACKALLGIADDPTVSKPFGGVNEDARGNAVVKHATRITSGIEDLRRAYGRLMWNDSNERRR